MAVELIYVIATCGSLFFLENKNDGSLRRGKPGDSTGRSGIQALRVHLALVRVRGHRKRIILAYFWKSIEERPFPYA